MIDAKTIHKEVRTGTICAWMGLLPRPGIVSNGKWESASLGRRNGSCKKDGGRVAGDLNEKSKKNDYCCRCLPTIADNAREKGKTSRPPRYAEDGYGRGKRKVEFSVGAGIFPEPDRPVGRRLREKEKRGITESACNQLN